MAIAREYWQVQGARGREGTDGADGAAGANAYTRTTASFSMPAEGASVTVAVSNSAWMVIGQPVVIGDSAGSGSYTGTFIVSTVPSSTTVVLTNPKSTASGLYTANITPATVVASGKTVTPGGFQGPAGT